MLLVGLFIGFILIAFAIDMRFDFSGKRKNLDEKKRWCINLIAIIGVLVILGSIGYTIIQVKQESQQKDQAIAIEQQKIKDEQAKRIDFKGHEKDIGQGVIDLLAKNHEASSISLANGILTIHANMAIADVNDLANRGSLAVAVNAQNVYGCTIKGFSLRVIIVDDKTNKVLFDDIRTWPK